MADDVVEKCKALERVGIYRSGNPTVNVEQVGFQSFVCFGCVGGISVISGGGCGCGSGIWEWAGG